MSYYQLSMEDIENQKILQAVSDRTAYIDEYGSFGFDFSSTGASKEPLNKSPSFSAERENRRLPLGSSDSVGK